jgi:hypothetical protein
MSLTVLIVLSVAAVVIAVAMQTAIKNVRLLDEAKAQKRALSESLERQTATVEVTSEMLRVISNSPDDLRRVLQSILPALLARADEVIK